MQIRISILLLPAFLALCAAGRASSTPASVAAKFCELELEGVGLDSRYSRSLWSLTTGDEEPFMGDSEVATGCTVSRVERTSANNAVVTVRYDVIGRIIEDADGSRRLVKTKAQEDRRLGLSLVNGSWKINKESLMQLPWIARPRAWANHFEKLLKSGKNIDVDHTLTLLIADLRTM